VLILFDHGTPKGLIRALPGHTVHTAQSKGWDTLSNGALLNAAEEAGFERCGFLAGGFARFHCGECGLDRLVAFSCKGRALCPSCGGRRMAEPAAHLVDHVIPDVPVRQWVLSLPYRLRYRLAWDHDRCRRAAVFLGAVFRLGPCHARWNGLDLHAGLVVPAGQRDRLERLDMALAGAIIGAFGETPVGQC
jgi:hypothetical protein